MGAFEDGVADVQDGDWDMASVKDIHAFAFKIASERQGSGNLDAYHQGVAQGLIDIYEERKALPDAGQSVSVNPEELRIGYSSWVTDLVDELANGCDNNPRAWVNVLRPIIKDAGVGRDVSTLIATHVHSCHSGRETYSNDRLSRVSKALYEQIANASTSQLIAYGEHADRVFNE